jgi:hypothetical protein
VHWFSTHIVEQQSVPLVHQDRIPFGTQQRPRRQAYASQHVPPPSVPQLSPAPRHTGGPPSLVASVEASAAEPELLASSEPALAALPPAASVSAPALPAAAPAPAPLPAVAPAPAPPLVEAPAPALPALAEPPFANAAGASSSSLPHATPSATSTHIEQVNFDFI